MKGSVLREKVIHLLSKFVEDIILPFVLISFCAIFWCSYFYKDKYGFSAEIFKFFIDDLGYYLVFKDGSIVTVATVFIGIYFSIYTMLTSIQTDSVLSNLGRKNFKKLLSILGMGFISSFSYTLYSIFFIKSYEINKQGTVFWLLLCLILFMTSAFQFGVIIYIILKRDIAKTIEELEERRLRESRNAALLDKLEAFLDKEKNKEDYERAKDISIHLEKPPSI
jgi:hypothetical protein